MNRHFGGALALLFCASPFPAISQGMEAVSVTGQMELEHTRRNGASGTLLSGDFTLAYSGGFGFELGVVADQDLQNGTDAFALFGAVTFGTAFGDVAVGAPRPVADQLIDIPVFAGIHELQMGINATQPSVVTALSQVSGDQSYGARLTTETGALRYGASVHRLTSQSGTYWQLAGEYDTGSGTEIEGVIEGEDGNLGVLVGANHTAGQFDLGLYLTSQHINGTSDAVQGYAGYQISDALTVRGHLRMEDGPVISQNIVGVEASYDFTNGAYAQFGAADGNQTSMTLDASVGFKF